MPVLDELQVEEWRERGCVVVDCKQHDDSRATGWVITQEEAQHFRNAARTAILGNGADIQPLPDTKSFGGVGFPFLGRNSEPLNQLCLHERMLQAVKQLLRVEDSPVLMTQADCWVKQDLKHDSGLPAEYENTDQRMHMDYPNHYLTHPTPWYEPEAVAIIVYLDNEDCGGATRFVPRRDVHDEAYQYPYINNPGVAQIPWINDRTLAEDHLRNHFPEAFRFREKLYQREQPVSYSIGTILFYRLDLWHRGTPLNKGKERAVVNLLYKKQTAQHITSWHVGWARNVSSSHTHASVN